MDQKEKLVEILSRHMRKAFAEDLAEELIVSGFVDISHIQLLEIEKDYGSFQLPEVVLFNENHVTQEEAMRAVQTGEYYASVLSLPKSQWATLFLNRKED